MCSSALDPTTGLDGLRWKASQTVSILSAVTGFFFFASFFPQHRPSLQLLVMPFRYGLAIRWILSIFLSKSSLNTHRKLQLFRQPITALNFLSNCEHYHFSFHLFHALLHRCVPHMHTSIPYSQSFSKIKSKS